MKTLKKGSDIKRFDDETADRKVRNEGYSYVSKSVWKEIRDAEKEQVKKDSGRTAPPPIKKKVKK